MGQEGPGAPALRAAEECLLGVLDDLAAFMKTTRSATLRANPISWGTTIIVIPTCASAD
jgi:hypothetical protein